MKHTVKTVYLDCFSGVSGDMLLGALLHAGLDEALLREELAKLPLPELRLDVEKATCQSIGCRKVKIHQSSGQQLRTLPVILPLLEESELDPPVIQKASEVFRLLAEAEAKVHETGIDRVHFHEIGALDTIADIVGVVAGLHHLGIERIVCSPLPLGRGFIDCDHGRLPLPAPAVCELLQGIPTYGVDIPKELVTPTGAALVRILADDFGTMGPMSIASSGYGRGSHDLPNNQPNLLRLIIGTAQEEQESQDIVVIETRLDDWSPEGFPYLCSLLMDQGALDVSLTACQGKKGRPGHAMQVLCPPYAATLLQDILFRETTTIGLRYRTENRRTLPRQPMEIDSPWGPLTVKKVATPEGIRIYPEYEECRKVAERHKVPLDDVYRAVYAKGVSL